MAKKPSKQATVTDFEGDDEAEGDGTVTKTEAQIREEILAQQAEIRALCKLAGKPDLAEGFIQANKSRADVMAALQKAAEGEGDAGSKGKAKSGSEVSAHNNPREVGGGETPSIDSPKIWDRWNSAGRKSA